MKILFIVPGSGDTFYCGNCFRDNLLASAMRKTGHNVVVMPLYLPLRYTSFQGDTPLFFPATTYYTAQRFFGKRKMPKWLEHITGSDRMLNLASSMSGTTSAEGMETMTMSMITGDDPAFANYVSLLIDWIKNEETPDVIHLSSSLLIGIAKELKHHFDTPIVCSVQDEEIWIDSLKKSYAGIAWHSIADNVGYINRFITTSEFYKAAVQKRIPRINHVEVIYPGVDHERYYATEFPNKPTIGFFYRMSRVNGLDILAEAFVKLKERKVIPNLQLKIGGGFSGKDKPFLKHVKEILKPYKEDVEIFDKYKLEDHATFYHAISAICVPITFEESVGLYLCEAFASGRPAVEPATGSFPEIVSEAGILYHPNDSESLCNALQQLLSDPFRYEQASAKAIELSQTRYNYQVMAQKLIKIYTSLFNNYHGIS